MTPHGGTADGAESIDPRHFARRASLDRDDDQSIAPRHFAPMPGPLGSGDEGIAPQHPAPAGDVGTRGVGAEAEHSPDEPRGFARLRSQKRAILAEQRADWDEGRPVPPEDLLRRWPTDPATDPDAASLLVEDYFQRRKRGEDPGLGDYEDRFPEQSRSLVSLVSRHNAFRNLDATGSNHGATLRLPDVGDEVFGFRLKHALGRGAFARVFLAEQGRPRRPPGRAQGLGHRGDRAADPGPAAAHQHRPDLLGPRGRPRRPPRRLHALLRRAPASRPS